MTLFSTLLHVGMKGPICMTDSVKVGLLETLLIREVTPTLGDFPCCQPDIKCLYRLCRITLPWHLTLIPSTAKPMVLFHPVWCPRTVNASQGAHKVTQADVSPGGESRGLKLLSVAVN